MGRLLYWDVPCSCMTTETACPNGEACVFAHSREEISYHPAKYKTRRCNGRGCRGEAICCFAHGEAELRVWAPDRYSYWSLATGTSASASAAEWPVAAVTAAAALAAGATGTEEWRRPPYARGVHLPAARHKQRFCASFPDVAQCRRGAACAFAHSREEAQTSLLSLEQEQQVPGALTEEFFMYRFKTLWCPIGVQHDWQTCVYAHNYQDARRQVSIGYGPRPCPYWAKKDPGAEYSQRCPLGLRCPFSHGAKEQLYHPQYFRTVICRDLRANACPRQRLCAFFHRRAERRKPPADSTDCSIPLREEALPGAWVADFLLPPFRDAAGMPTGDGGDNEGASALGGACMDEQYWYTHYGLGTGMMDGAEEDDHHGARLLALPPEADVEEEGYNGTPRTQSGESDAADNSSTSTSHEAQGGKRAPGAGVVKSSRPAAAAGPTGAAAAFDESLPWKVQAPTYGPFGDPFDAFPGFLANAGEMDAMGHSASSWWGRAEGEPQMVL